MDIMLSGVFFLGGFLWTYLFLRQLMFNIMVAHPMIRKMNGLQKDLIASGATKYTIMSDAVCFVVAGLILFLIIGGKLCALYSTVGKIHDIPDDALMIFQQMLEMRSGENVFERPLNRMRKIRLFG